MPDLDWTTFGIRVAFFIGGMVAGTLLGWQARILRYERDTAQEVTRMRHQHHDDDQDDEHGSATLNGVALAVIVIITAAAAVISGIAAQSAQDAQARQARTGECTARILSKTVHALNQRNAYTDEQADRSDDVLAAQLQFLVKVLHPGDSGPAALREYVQAVRQVRRANALAAATRRQNPYPTTQQIRSCIRGED